MFSADRKTIFKRILATTFIVAFAVLFLPFYAELLLAAVFAFAMEPTLGRWLQPRHLRWRTSVALILAAMFVVVAAPITIVFYKIYASVVEVSKAGIQNTEIFKKLTVLKGQLLGAVTRVTEMVGVSEQVDFSALSDDSLGTVGNHVLAFFSGMITQIPGMAISVFIFVAALYFFLAEAGVLRNLFTRQQLLEPHESERLIGVVQRACHSTVVTSVIIGFLQASIVGFGALFCGVGDFMVVFVITFFCSFIPVIGAGPVALALGAYQALLGSYGTAIALAVIAVVAGTVDNLVRPYLISNSEGDLHPIVSLLAIIGALMVFGMPGLLLGPVIASVAVKIIPTLYAPVTVDAKDLGKRPIADARE